MRWAAVTAAVAVLVSGCDRAAPPVRELRVDGERALALTGELVAIRPRHSGTPGAEQAADWIAGAIAEIGLDADIDSFSDPTPRGPATFRNVTARIPGRRGHGFVVVGSHYDGKYLPTVPDFAGANDSGSSTGLLLEIMRVIHVAGKWPGPELRFVFFDGEECREHYGPTDGFHGSRRYVDLLRQHGEIADCRAMILLDMIGDRDLSVTLPTDSDPRLARLLLDIAREQGHSEAFGFWPSGTLLDDHKAFQDAGIPAVDIIDFRYGPDNAWWHTDADTMDKLSAESLAVVGNVVLSLLQRLP